MENDDKQAEETLYRKESYLYPDSLTQTLFSGAYQHTPQSSISRTEINPHLRDIHSKIRDLYDSLKDFKEHPGEEGESYKSPENLRSAVLQIIFL